MKYLLDTRAFLWALISPEKLTEAARTAISHTDNPVSVSAVSFWEIALKYRLGKLELSGVTPEALPDAALRQGFELMPLDARLADGFSAMPDIPKQRDPFDRSIDNRVTRLRRKIELEPAAPAYIRTVRGEGYLFTPQGSQA